MKKRQTDLIFCFRKITMSTMSDAEMLKSCKNHMQDKAQPEKLPQLLSPLRSFLKEAFQETDPSKFFRILCEEIMSFVFQCSLIEPTRNRFETERQKHSTLISQLEKTTKRQVRDWYKKLVDCIKGSPIAKEKYISESLSQIDGLLNNNIKNRYCTPPEYEIAHDIIRDVCCEIVKKGHGSLISEFVDIISKDIQIVDREEVKRLYQLNLLKKGDMAPFILVQEHYVERTKFAPARWKLQKARALLSDLESQTPWVVYNYL